MQLFEKAFTSCLTTCFYFTFTTLLLRFYYMLLFHLSLLRFPSLRLLETFSLFSLHLCTFLLTIQLFPSTFSEAPNYASLKNKNYCRGIVHVGAQLRYCNEWWRDTLYDKAAYWPRSVKFFISCSLVLVIFPAVFIGNYLKFAIMNSL